MIELGERFWSKTREIDGPLDTPCRVWTGATVTNRRGEKYGKLQYQGAFVLAHRISAAERAGMTLDELRTATDRQVLHGCDNPLCVVHGRFGTQSENMIEMHQRGRHPRSRKEA
jgi:hypothetical protein